MNVNSTIRNAYAMWSKDDKSRKKSASGGLATALAQAMIEKGGVVYGCAFVPPFDFRHIRCTTKEDLERLRGSKYVQSNMRGVCAQVVTDLKSELPVLFIGTPCQVNAVRRAAKDLDKNLFCADLICHGVPSLQVLRDSLPKHLPEMDSFRFRNGNDFYIQACKSGKQVFMRPLRKDLYMKGFFKAVFYRGSCYKCQFAGTKRVGDITIGDFWGVDRKAIPTDIGLGLSLALVNTDKGERMKLSILPSMHCVERPVAEAVAGNKQLQYPMRRTWRTAVFNFLYPRLGFRFAAICAMPDIVIKNLMFKR